MYKTKSPCLGSSSVWNALCPTPPPGWTAIVSVHVCPWRVRRASHLCPYLPPPGSTSISQQGAVARAQNRRLVSNGNLFQMLALPLTSCLTSCKLTSGYFDFLLCRNGDQRVVGRIKSLAICGAPRRAPGTGEGLWKDSSSLFIITVTTGYCC